jgi:hypothetical protein
MFDPRRIVLSTKRLMIIRHEETDRNGPAPWREVWDLRRYEFVFRPGTPKHWSIGPFAHKWSSF